MTIAVMRHILCEKQKINPSDLERYVRNLLSAHDEDNKPVLEIKALEGYMEDELQE